MMNAAHCALFALVLLLGGACVTTPGSSLLVVSVHGEVEVRDVDRLRVAVFEGTEDVDGKDRAGPWDLPMPGAPATLGASPQTFSVRFPAALPASFVVEVTALDAAGHFLATGARSAQVVASETATVDVPVKAVSLRWTARASGVTADLHGIVGTGQRQVYAVGDSGVIIHSTDEGVTWKQEQSGTTRSLHAVWGVGVWVWAAGDDGTILRSNDRGVTWEPAQVPTSEPLRALAGIDPELVYAVGDHGAVMREIGGQNAWTHVPMQPAVDEPLRGISLALRAPGQFDSMVVGGATEGGFYALGLASGDLLAYWLPPSTSPLNAVGDGWLARPWSATDRVHDLILAGDGGALVGYPSGEALLRSGTAERLTAVWGAPDRGVFVVGAGGTVLYCEEIVRPWLRVETGTSADLHGVWGTSRSDVLVVGAGGLILHGGP